MLNEKKFSFISLAGQIPEDSFAVVSFTGYEAISAPYGFELILVAENHDIDPLLILQNPAKFIIHRTQGEDVEFNGILTQFEETQEFNGYLFFKAVLAPKLWWLSLTHHNQVFLGLTIPEIMEQALKDGGLAPGIDFEFRIQHQYEPLEYVCQYNESHLNFVSRWAEREGIYYFFEQTAKGEKVIFTDTKISHVDLVYNKDIFYQPQSGLDTLHTKEVVKNFICRHNMIPMRVYLKDYNYLKPSLAIEGIADVDENGRGENYIYGEHFDTPEQGNRLAKIRAEELKCRKSLFIGESSVPFMVPGFTFNLKKYYRGIYNRKYLITDVNHEGHQTGYLISGLVEAVARREESMMYKNTFTAIYSDSQFRPVREAVKPKISGTLNAKIDAAASGEYAELDELGRYKVRLPFDRSGRAGGKASAWFRMMQPYAGQNQGMHFPLHKGTEVLLTFIDGDPDRPLIAGAVPNPEAVSPVNSMNQTKSIIKTGRSHVDRSVGAGDLKARTHSDANNYISFNDARNSENIIIHSKGNKSSWSRHGKGVNDPDNNDAATSNTDNKPGEEEIINTDGTKLYTDGKLSFQANKGHEKRIVGRSINTARDDTLVADHDLNDILTTMDNFAPENVYGYDEKQTLTASTANPPYRFPEDYNVQPVPDPCSSFKDYYNNAYREEVYYREDDGGWRYYYVNQYYFKDECTYDLTHAWREYWRWWIHKNKDPSATNSAWGTSDEPGYFDTSNSYNSDDDRLFAEYARYHGRTPSKEYIYEEQDYTDLMPGWDSYLSGKWTNWVQERRDAWKKWQPHVEKGHTTVSHRDTFNMQEGNIYDFGGYWNYNLGNCYVEEHLDQGAELNKTRDLDLLDKGGPDWTEVDWDKVMAKANDKNNPSEAPGTSDIIICDSYLWDSSSGGTNVWVNKSFGNSYSYSETNSIEVSTGSSLDIHHGGRHVEMGFRGNGSISSWSWAEAGAHKEKKWTPDGDLLFKADSDESTGITTEHKYCRTTGNLLSYNSSHQGFNSLHTFDFNWANSASASFTFAASADFKFNMAIATSLKISAGADFDFSLYGAIKTDISAYASIKLAMELSAALSMDISAGTGIAIEMDTKSVCKIEYDGESGKFQVKAAGCLSAEKAESLAAKIDTLRVRM